MEFKCNRDDLQDFEDITQQSYLKVSDSLDEFVFHLRAAIMNITEDLQKLVSEIAHLESKLDNLETIVKGHEDAIFNPKDGLRPLVLSQMDCEDRGDKKFIYLP